MHDGGEEARSGAAADSSHARGIAVHAVKSVSATQGWACTQIAPERAPCAIPAQAAAVQLQDSRHSTCLPHEHVPHQSADVPDGAADAVQQQRAAGDPKSQTGSHGFSSGPAAAEQPELDQASAASAVIVANQSLEDSLPAEPAAEASEVGSHSCPMSGRSSPLLHCNTLRPLQLPMTTVYCVA